MTYNTPKLYANLEERVLAEIPLREDEFCIYPKYVAKVLGIPDEVCKAILRDLRNQGKAVYVRGLMDDDGQLRGSGYMRIDR